MSFVATKFQLRFAKNGINSMSQTQKRLDRLCAKPPPADFTWNELVTALGSLGFVLDQTSGSSHCHFVHPKHPDAVIYTYRPHPQPVVLRAEIRQIVKHLKNLDLL